MAISLKMSTSQRTRAMYKIKVNNCKFLDLVIRILLIWAILMPKFSNLLRNSTIHFRVSIFGSIFPERHGFVAVPVTRSNNLISLHQLDRDKLEHVSLIQLVNGNYNETVTLRKHASKYKNMRKWMIEFLENLRIVALKLLELTRFLSPNLQFTVIYFNFVRWLGSLWSKAIFYAQSIYRKVYDVIIILTLVKFILTLVKFILTLVKFILTLVKFMLTLVTFVLTLVWFILTLVKFILTLQLHMSKIE